MKDLHQQEIQANALTAVYFYQNSPVRMSGLKAIQELLESPTLKLKRAADTRWLSLESACRTLVKVLPAVLVSLGREA